MTAPLKPLKSPSEAPSEDLASPTRPASIGGHCGDTWEPSLAWQPLDGTPWDGAITAKAPISAELAEKLADPSTGMLDILKAEFAEEVDRRTKAWADEENDRIINGDPSKRPVGLVDFGKNATVKLHGAEKVLTADALKALMAGMPRHEPVAAFIASEETQRGFDLGQSFVVPADPNKPRTLFGYPVVESEAVPTGEVLVFGSRETTRIPVTIDCSVKPFLVRIGSAMERLDDAMRRYASSLPIFGHRARTIDTPAKRRRATLRYIREAVYARRLGLEEPTL